MGRRKPLMRPIDGGMWVLEEEFRTMVFGYIIIVRKGFTWDGASIPFWAWGFIGHPMDDDYIIGALFHDALYGVALLPRILCDRIFKELLRRDGVSSVVRNIMFGAVRVGGNSGYKKSSKSEYVSIQNVRRLDKFSTLGAIL